jgi:hypothetical protein
MEEDHKAVAVSRCRFSVSILGAEKSGIGNSQFTKCVASEEVISIVELDW